MKGDRPFPRFISKGKGGLAKMLPQKRKLK